MRLNGINYVIQDTITVNFTYQKELIGKIVNHMNIYIFYNPCSFRTRTMGSKLKCLIKTCSAYVQQEK